LKLTKKRYKLTETDFFIPNAFANICIVQQQQLNNNTMETFGYAIYDNVTCSLVTFAKDSAQVIIYGDYEEALEDCAKGQIVIELI
jgi:hypothetical protein